MAIGIITAFIQGIRMRRDRLKQLLQFSDYVECVDQSPHKQQPVQPAPENREQASFIESPYGIPYLKDPPAMPEICPMRDVDLNTINNSFGRIASAYDCPSLTGVLQRLFIFGLIAAKRPQRILELGFRFGGTSFLMLSALQDVGNNGKLVALDPCPEPALDFSRFGDRFFLYKGASPYDVGPAVKELGGLIDFCHIDADHIYKAVMADLTAVMPYMNDDSYILLHDACWPDVKNAIRDFLALHPHEIVDCGLIDPFANPEGWSGMHLLRVPPKRT
jgi:hypothetical protein